MAKMVLPVNSIQKT